MMARVWFGGVLPGRLALLAPIAAAVGCSSGVIAGKSPPSDGGCYKIEESKPITELCFAESDRSPYDKGITLAVKVERTQQEKVRVEVLDQRELRVRPIGRWMNDYHILRLPRRPHVFHGLPRESRFPFKIEFLEGCQVAGVSLVPGRAAYVYSSRSDSGAKCQNDERNESSQEAAQKEKVAQGDDTMTEAGNGSVAVPQGRGGSSHEQPPAESGREGGE